MTSLKKPRISTTVGESSSSLVTASSSNTIAVDVKTQLYRYLQGRKYSPSLIESYRKMGLPPKELLSQPKQAMALREVIQSETSCFNAFSLSSNHTEPTVIDQQYSKFKNWISESPDAYKPELLQLLYPVFTHLYLEIVASGQKLAAAKFMKKHQPTFMGNAEFSNFIRHLINVTLPEELFNDEVANSYHTSKYSVTISQRTFHVLKKFLQLDKQPPVLVCILHSKVDLRVSDGQTTACSKVESIDQMRHANDRMPELPAIHLTNQKTEDWSKLQEMIRTMRDSVTILPSTCLYRLSSDASHITSAVVSRDAGHMAVASEDSSINMWSLYPASSRRKNCDDGDEENSVASVGLQCRPHFEDGQNTFSTFNKSINSNSSSDSGTNLVLRGHSGPVYDVAFYPDSSLLLSCSEDTSMRAWDYKTGVNKALYRGHSYPIWSVDVDSIGHSIVTGSMDRTAKLWNLEYTFPIRFYSGHEKDVDVVKFHPNGNYLATAGADKTIRLWSHADANQIRVLSGHKGGIFSLAFSPDGKVLASAGEDRRIRLWDITSAKVIKELRGHTDTIYSLVWSGDSSILASGGLDGCLRLWNVNGIDRGLANGPSIESQSNNVSQEIEATFPTSCSNILNLCYSPYNTLVATGVGGSTLNNSSLSVIKNFHIANGSNTN